MTKAVIARAATDGITICEIAEEAFAALNSGGRHVLPFSTRYPAFSLNEAYRVAALANNMRIARAPACTQSSDALSHGEEFSIATDLFAHPAPIYWRDRLFSKMHLYVLRLCAAVNPP
jgi:hypothetical protein